MDHEKRTGKFRNRLTYELDKTDRMKKKKLRDYSDFRRFRFRADGDVQVTVWMVMSGSVDLGISEGEREYALEKNEGEEHASLYLLEERKDETGKLRRDCEYDPIKIRMEGLQEYHGLVDKLTKMDCTVHSLKKMENGETY